MRERRALLAVAGLAFVAVALATLPAALVAGHLPPAVRLGEVSGSVWSGHAESLQLNGTAVGAVDWHVHAWRLLLGRLDLELELSRADGHLRGHFTLAPGGHLEGRDLDLALGLAAFGEAGPGGVWGGEVSGRLSALTLERGWPVALAGHVTLSHLRPPGASAEIGAYLVEFDGASPGRGALVGRVRDAGAPLELRAQLTLARERSYVLAGDVTPRAGAPAEVLQAIAFLGTADAAGRRQFSLTGSYP